MQYTRLANTRSVSTVLVSSTGTLAELVDLAALADVAIFRRFIFTACSVPGWANAGRLSASAPA